MLIIAPETALPNNRGDCRIYIVLETIGCLPLSIYKFKFVYQI